MEDDDVLLEEDRLLAGIALSVMGSDIEREQQALDAEARDGPFAEAADDDEQQRVGETDAQFARRLLDAANDVDENSALEASRAFQCADHGAVLV